MGFAWVFTLEAAEALAAAEEEAVPGILVVGTFSDAPSKSIFLNLCFYV